MSNQQTMEEILAENEKLKQENKILKKKKRKTKTFVQENLGLFESLLDVKGKVLPLFLNGQEGDEKRHPRYFFSRPTKDKKSTEQVIRLNLLVADLLEAKIRLNPSMKDCTETEFNARLSMDTSSLIRHISIKPNTGKARAARPRKKNAKTESKPPVQEKAIPGDAVGKLIAGSRPVDPTPPHPRHDQDFASMSVDDVFAYAKANINPSPEIRQTLIKQLIKYGASARLDELRAVIGVSVPNWKVAVDSVS